MKLRVSFLIICFTFLGVHPGQLNSFSVSAPTDTGEVRITSEYRRLCQGEMIKVAIVSPGTVSARLSFDERIVPFVTDGQGKERFALIPLGVDMQPGDHDAVIHLSPVRGPPRDIPFKLRVSPGAFPSQTLRVARRFTSPSPEDIKRIQAEQGLLSRIYGSYIPEWLGRKGFVMPITGRITGPFGERRVFNGKTVSRHRGVDIASPRGSPVRACNRGKVVLARDLFFSGNTVIIDHGIGLFSIYCHLSETVAREDSIIDTGTVFGYVGSTGRSTGPHLHWGLRLVDEYVDPLSVMRLSFY